MCFDKITRFIHTYKKRCVSFLSSTIAGLFTGVMIGIFFSLVTDIDFNRWINLGNYELFAGIIYVLFTYALLYLLYLLGTLLVWVICLVFKIRNRYQEKINFKINYFASALATLFITPLILLEGNMKTQLTISIVFILLYFPTMFWIVRDSKKK